MIVSLRWVFLFSSLPPRQSLEVDEPPRHFFALSHSHMEAMYVPKFRLNNSSGMEDGFQPELKLEVVRLHAKWFSNCVALYSTCFSIHFHTAWTNLLHLSVHYELISPEKIILVSKNKKKSLESSFIVHNLSKCWVRFSVCWSSSWLVESGADDEPLLELSRSTSKINELNYIFHTLSMMIRELLLSLLQKTEKLV